MLFIVFLNENLLEAVVQRCSGKKVFLKFHKIYSKKPVENVYSGIQFNNKQNKYKLIHYLIIGRDKLLFILFIKKPVCSACNFI